MTSGWTGWNWSIRSCPFMTIIRYKTQILAASLRYPNHVTAAAMAGAHIGTMPFKVLDSMFSHPLTDRGLEQFLKDWGKVFQDSASR